MAIGQRAATRWGIAIVPIAGVLVLGGGLANGASSSATALGSERIEAAGSALQELADAKGALGYYWDDATREYVVVVPSTGESSFRVTDALSLTADVRIESRDISRETVDQISSALVNLQSSIKGLGFGFFLDPELGKVILQSEAPWYIVA